MAKPTKAISTTNGALILLVVAAIAGGLTAWYLNSTVVAAVNNLQSQVDSLNTQVRGINEKLDKQQ